jgi:hypothetical protein
VDLAASTSLVMPPSWSLIKTWRGHRAGFLPSGSFMGHIGHRAEFVARGSSTHRHQVVAAVMVVRMMVMVMLMVIMMVMVHRWFSCDWSHGAKLV